jgi:oligopeptidase A
MTSNPLDPGELPIPFHRIGAHDIGPAVRAAIAEAERAVEERVGRAVAPTWRNTLGLIDEHGERLGRVLRPAAHLAHVLSTPEIRAAYDEVVPEISSFYARLPLHEGLWKVVRDFAATDEARALDSVRRRHLEKTLREFIRAGADLPPEGKLRVQEIRVELARLHTRFANNVLDATNAFELVLTDEEDLAGLPPSARAQARESAAARGVEGWRFTLQAPSYQPFIQYSEKRDLRRRMYEAFMNRASEGKLDNRPIIGRILELRAELARLLGYRSYADLRLEENMVGSGRQAMAFVSDLTTRLRPHWEREVAELVDFAREMGLDPLEPWDTAFVAERLRRQRFSLDEEALRPYFPLHGVLDGMFEIARRLFDVRVTERKLEEVWHPDVRYYEVHDESGELLGGFYADWFPRETKRAGAWMNNLVLGGPTESGWEPHLGLVVANFSPPARESPALLTHREVETTFHEFGHLLHHLLSRVEVRSRAGTNVALDWVELPSQIMENWCWEREALDLFARHHRTGEPLPQALFDRMRSARTFLAASHQMRQLSFGMVDLALHVDFDQARDGDLVEYAQRTAAPYQIRPEFAKNHFITAFSHIFAGGYAAGYYSYLWSEVLDADAFTRFRDQGIFSRDAGIAFRKEILARGDEADPAELFRSFLGRDPDPEALLRRNLGEQTLEMA